ncbi:hypothetical protein TNCV_1998921 [Trichonephila clavipes]|nr:hypothetical protein TNCV_1998921 [Trichonephila clavipes]
MNTHRRAAAVVCRCHRSACTKTRPDSRVVPRRKKGDEHPPPSGCRRMSLSSFRVHQDATGHQSNASTEKSDEYPPPSGGRMSLSSFRVHKDATDDEPLASSAIVRRKKVTNTHRRAGAVGCRCHRSACTKTRPDSRVVRRRKKSDEYPPPSGCGRMSLSSFRVHQDATGHQSKAPTEKSDETHRRVVP